METEDRVTAALAGILELAGERIELLDRMAAMPLGGGEWAEAHDRYSDIQGELADWAPRLVAALDEVLRLTAPPAPLDVLFFGGAPGPEVSKEAVREAITSALAGKE